MKKMQPYYLDIETYRTGDRVNPSTDPIITIQYQPLDLKTGLPQGDLTILKSWESSEETIVQDFFNRFYRPDIRRDIFVPVGFSLHFEFEALLSRFKKYNLGSVSCREMYYDRKYVDIKPIIILINKGSFEGAKLNNFTDKPSDGSVIKDYYENNEYDKIEAYIKTETASFLGILQKITKNIGELGVKRKIVD
ncbi:MAG: hypothetical protein WC379_14995 [Methanoregula sp.]|jgi:hypothetical protein